MATHPRAVTANAFHAALVAAGVIRDGEHIRRIVIDAQEGHPVMIHVERYGDERLLDVVRTLDGVEVRTGTPDLAAGAEFEEPPMIERTEA